MRTTLYRYKGGVHLRHSSSSFLRKAAHFLLYGEKIQIRKKGSPSFVNKGFTSLGNNYIHRKRTKGGKRVIFDAERERAQFLTKKKV